MKLIYVVEDDESIRELVCYALQSSGFTAMGFSSAKKFWPAMEEELPSLILLDIMLPGEDGLCILEKIRKNVRYNQIPIIMLTAKSSEYDKVKGLDLGADDYIGKPFGIMEMISRVKAVLRRAHDDIKETEDILSYGGVILDSRRHLVRAGENDCNLTNKEFELLEYLLRNIDIVISRDRLMDAVWGFDFEGGSRTIDMHIGTLRQKLGEYGSIIKTVRGVGYKIGG